MSMPAHAPESPPAFNAADISLSPDTIYRGAFTSVTDVVETVRRWGIVVFPGFVPAGPLARLNAEFDTLIAVRRSLGFQLDEYENIANIRVLRPQLDAALYPETAAFFANPLMGEVADGYFGAGRYRLNGEIFVSNITETHGPQFDPPFALHFDKRQVLKFFVYLTDTDERNGAMRVLPGSNIRNRAARTDAMARSALKDIPNVLPEPATPSLPVCGPAGTMFVFDTDMCHGASTVQPGFTRRTMRGHTHSQAMLQAMGVH
jgi:hypothetical protein